MVSQRAYDPTDRDQVVAELRREILAARLKVTIDKKLKRKPSAASLRLAGTKLPPTGRAHYAVRPVPVVDIGSIQPDDSSGSWIAGRSSAPADYAASEHQPKHH